MAKLIDIEPGQIWVVKVSGRRVHCRVEEIKPAPRPRGQRRIVLTNMRTGRTIERSARALRYQIKGS